MSRLHTNDGMPSGLRLFGREAERVAIRRTLMAACRRVATVLVLRGEVGVGKTALLRDAVARTPGVRVLRLTGFESETAWSYSGLQQIAAQLADDLPALPTVQRSAIESAVGTADGEVGDPAQLDAAVLGLLAQCWARSPVLLVVDDEHWLDPQSRRLFGRLATRFVSEPVAVLAATALSAPSVFAPAPELAVTPLSRQAAGQLLATSARGPIAPHVAAKIIALVGANPAGLVDAGRRLSSDERAGATGLPDPLPPGPQLQPHFDRWLGRLTSDARMAAIVAALELTDSPIRARSAMARLQIDTDLAMASPLDERLRLAGTIAFTPPLVRSAVSCDASPGERHAAHEALAQVSRAAGDDACEAWHRASLALGPDHSVAAELEAAAEEIRRRLGDSAGAAVRVRVAELSVGGPDYGRRARAGATALIALGRLGDASELLEQSSPTSARDDGQPDSLALKGRVQHERGDRVAARTLLIAARATTTGDPNRRQGLLRNAWAAALDFGDPDLGETLSEILAELAVAPESSSHLNGARVGRLAPRASRQSTATTASDTGHGGPGADPDDLTELTLAWMEAIQILDDRALSDVVRDLASAARRHPTPARRVAALARIAISRVLVGDLAAAGSLIDQVMAEAMIDVRLGTTLLPAHALLLSWLGRTPAVRDVIRRLPPDEARRPAVRAVTGPSVLIVELADGHFAAAAHTAHEIRLPEGHPWPSWACADIVEAFVRAGLRDEARTVHASFGRLLHGRSSNWARGLLSRCEGFLADDDQQIEQAFRASIDHLSTAGVVLELARSRLVYGEWLRRQRRRRDARRQLRAAHGAFAQAGGVLFASRANRELDATAERVGPRRVEDRDRLTPRERQVARLAAGGATTNSIAESLLLTPATVAGHLNSVYRKLGVTRRTALRRALDQLPDEPRM